VFRREAISLLLIIEEQLNMGRWTSCGRSSKLCGAEALGEDGQGFLRGLLPQTWLLFFAGKTRAIVRDPSGKETRMSPEFEALVNELKKNPGLMYVTADGTKLFMFVGDDLLCVVGTDLNKKTEEELNRLIQDYLLDLMNQHKA
jgi:hypothetical protein